MNIIFFGSDDFALTHLETLCHSEHKVLACVTQPDRPKGRGLPMTVSVIKEFSVKNKIPVFQPTDLHDQNFIEELGRLQSDIFVVIAYGRILPTEILSIPKIFSVNVHASLLPRYRGAAPINWAIINGDTKTGVTLIKMNELMDAGEIIAQETVTIEENDNATTLRARLAKASGPLLLHTLKSIHDNKFHLTKQDLSKVSYAPKLTKDLGVIRWEEKATTIHNLVRGLIPWPNAFSYVKGKRFKILETEVIEDFDSRCQAGEVFSVSREGIDVMAGYGALSIKKVQPDNGKPMEAHSFASGYKIGVGVKLG